MNLAKAEKIHICLERQQEERLKNITSISVRVHSKCRLGNSSLSCIIVVAMFVATVVADDDNK